MFHVELSRKSSENVSAPWNTKGLNAENSLRKASQAVADTTRTAAANATVLATPVHLRGAAIRGVCSYLEASADEILSPTASPLARRHIISKEAESLTPEIVQATRDLTLALGTRAAANVRLVRRVAVMVGANARPESYVSAFQALMYAN